MDKILDVEALKALPDGTVLRDADGYLVEVLPAGLFQIRARTYYPSIFAEDDFPMTVLHKPRLLAEVWQEAYDTGYVDRVEEKMPHRANPYLED